MSCNMEKQGSDALAPILGYDTDCAELDRVRPGKSLEPQFSGRTLPCEARRERTMQWSARGVAAMPFHRPLQLLVRRHART
jgi:hypothetical protein